MKNIFAVLALILGFASVSQANFIMEPYLGYDMGNYKEKYTDNTSAKYDSSAVDAGLRLGFRNAGFWMAVDGDYGFSGKLKPTTGDSWSTTSVTAYVSLGYDFMTRIRIYGGVGFLDSMQQKLDGVTDTFQGGTPYKVGLGYWLLPHLCINVEYDAHDYKNVKTDSYNGAIKDDGYTSVTNNVVMVNFSIPYTF